MRKSTESILDIDRKTRELEEDTRRSIGQIGTSFCKELSSLKYQRPKGVKEKAKRSYDRTLDPFAGDIEPVKSVSRAQSKSMDPEYDEVRDVLVEHAFTKILGKENVGSGQ